MMKEEKGNIEQMSERLFHYLRKRESSASQEAEDEVWSKISEQIDKKKHIPVYRWLIPVTAVAAASLLFVFWLNNQAYDTIHSADVQEFVSAANTPEKHIELITATGTKIKVDEKATVAYAQDGSLLIDEKKIATRQSTGEGEEEHPMNQIIVPMGKHIKLQLSDGSQLDINSGTKVVYPQKFKKEYREIFVEGEIFIDVTHKESNIPFIVKTSLFTVNVLGTAFNVKAYKEDTKAEVVLVRGKVEVKDKKEQNYTLMPNELIALNEGTYTDKKKVNALDYISWIDGILTLNNQALSIVLEQLHRYYGKEIIYDTGIETMPMHGKLDLNEGLQKVLSTIAITAPVTIEEKNNIYYVHRRKEN